MTAPVNLVRCRPCSGQVQSPQRSLQRSDVLRHRLPRRLLDAMSRLAQQPQLPRLVPQDAAQMTHQVPRGKPFSRQDPGDEGRREHRSVRDHSDAEAALSLQVGQGRRQPLTRGGRHRPHRLLPLTLLKRGHRPRRGKRRCSLSDSTVIQQPPHPVRTPLGAGRLSSDIHRLGNVLPPGTTVPIRPDLSREKVVNLLLNSPGTLHQFPQTLTRVRRLQQKASQPVSLSRNLMPRRRPGVTGGGLSRSRRLCA